MWISKPSSKMTYKTQNLTFLGITQTSKSPCRFRPSSRAPARRKMWCQSTWSSLCWETRLRRANSRRRKSGWCISKGMLSAQSFARSRFGTKSGRSALSKWVLTTCSQSNTTKEQPRRCSPMPSYQNSLTIRKACLKTLGSLRWTKWRKESRMDTSI